MLAHVTAGGARLTAGDLFGTGTISGEESGSEGCMLERFGGERWLEWLETGAANAAQLNTRRGYGRELIEVALPRAMGAQTRLELDDTGTVRCSIALPNAE